jgi:predicted PurR-regulated permease PerM
MREPATRATPPPEARPTSEPGREETIRAKTWDARTASLVVIAAVAVVGALRYAAPVLIPVVLGLLIFCALDPLVARLAALGVHRALGAAVALVLATALVAAAAYGLRDDVMAVVDDLPNVAHAVRAELRDPASAPGALEKVQEAATEIERAAAEAAGEGSKPSGVTRVQVEQPTVDVKGTLRWGTLGLLALAGELTMVWFLTYFLLVNGDLHKRKLVSLVEPLSNKKVTVRMLDEIGAQMQRFLVTLLLTSVLVALTTWLALLWVGVEQAAVWGIAAGVFNSIPYFGPLMVTFGLSTVAFAQFGTVWMAAWVGFLALVITSLEGWVVTPVFMGKAARMNQVVIFVGLLFWTWAWGVWGLLLAVPMMMIFKSVCDHVEPLQPIGALLGE